MNTLIIPMSLSLMLMAPSITLAAAVSINPTVSFKSTSLGYPYTQTFQVNVQFSQPVSGLSLSQVNITNGSIESITGSGANYTLVVAPTQAGKVNISIPMNAVMSLTGTANQASDIFSINALDTLVRPSSNFDLTKWSLTLPLPLGSPGNAMSVNQATLAGDPSLNSGYTNKPYFFTDNTTGAMTFFAPLSGASTPNSHYARSELLEVLPGSSSTWRLNTFSSNLLIASVKASQVPPLTKRIIVAQIHDKATTDSYGNKVSTAPLLKLYYDSNPLDPNKNACNGCIYGQVRTTAAGNRFLKVVNLAKNIPLNTVFIYRITFVKDGTLTLQANDGSTVIKVNPSNNNTIGWGAQQLYFKAGVYLVENGTSKTTGGSDSFYSLQVIHNK